MERKLCPSCRQRPVAVNYVKNEKTYYRRLCDVCGKLKANQKPKAPAWFISGYRKKPHCEKCGFKAKFADQLAVFYVDGNLKNNDWSNLKTVCLNCQVEVFKLKLPWKAGPLLPDY
jgi:hypothetical protein